MARLTKLILMNKRLYRDLMAFLWFIKFIKHILLYRDCKLVMIYIGVCKCRPIETELGRNFNFTKLDVKQIINGDAK